MRKRQPTLSILIALCLALVSLGLVAPAVAATPSDQPSQTWMLDGKVWQLERAGGLTWAGGTFDRYLTATGEAGPAAKGLAAFDTDGMPADVEFPVLGGKATVVDLSYGPNGVLYVAGAFSYSVDGQSGRNLVGIDAGTGAIVQRFSAPGLKTVLATADRIYAGGRKMFSYRPDGTKDQGFTPAVPLVDDSLRSHTTPDQFRDIVEHGTSVIALGKFDFVNGQPRKVAVKLDAATGAVLDWRLGGIPEDSAAFGLEASLRGDALYVAAGGSDFVGAYDPGTGAQRWKTDTSGSAQATDVFDDETLIVGGHFKWVAQGPGQQCGSNKNPNRSCVKQPRLAAFNTLTGTLVSSWRPFVCCQYNGVWGLAVEEGAFIDVGGQFNQLGSQPQRFFGRFPVNAERRSVP